MIKNLSLILLFCLTTVAYAKVGGPAKVRCYVAALEYDKDIEKLTDINDLLTHSKRKIIAQSEVDSDVYEGQVQGGVVQIEEPGVYMRYHFNSQNGALELEDVGTSQSSYTLWLNQYEVTKSGYLLVSTWLTNRGGGLLGSKRIFQLEANCSATKWP